MASPRLSLLLALSCILATVALEPTSDEKQVPDEASTGLDSADNTLPAAAPHSEEEDKTSLAEALRLLRRRKREISDTHRPYSAFRPVGTGTHRYRYPLYRKRSTRLPLDYSSGPESYLTEIDSDYDDYGDVPEKFSLFRERERGPKPRLISNAHFSSKPTYYKRAMPNFLTRKLVSKDFNNFPSDFEGSQRFRDQRKLISRDSTPSNHLFETLSAMTAREGRLHPYQNAEKEMVYSDMLKTAIDQYNKGGSLNTGMIRRKRASLLPPNAASSLPDSSSSSAITTSPLASNESSNLSYTPRIPMTRPALFPRQSERQKRAFESPLFYDPKQEEASDFLTREYFKTIARSVGNKRKRMAFAQFEAVKRSNALDSFLENPKMLHFVQEQIKDAEEEVAKDAEDELERGASDVEVEEDMTSRVLLSNSIARLDALERMRQALYQLERLQEKEEIRKRAQNLVSEGERRGGIEEWNVEEEEEEEARNEIEKEKRRKAMKGRLTKEEEEQVEEERRKRKERTLRNLFMGNKRDECPVLERIVLNCVAITEMASEEAVAFLEPCLRHEVCYMCGSGLQVSQHECDALLSSALEASCNEAYVIPGPDNGARDCLSAAGKTYNLLGNAGRYDDKGTCTFDPCVRQLLNSR